MRAVASEYRYWTHRSVYYAALRLSPILYDLDYGAGGPGGATTSLSMLPQALASDGLRRDTA